MARTMKTRLEKLLELLDGNIQSAGQASADTYDLSLSAGAAVRIARAISGLVASIVQITGCWRAPKNLSQLL